MTIADRIFWTVIVALATFACVAGSGPPVPPGYTKSYTTYTSTNGAFLLMSTNLSQAVAPPSLAPNIAAVFVVPPPPPDITITPSLSPHTFAITVNNTNGVLQFSTNLVQWVDVPDYDHAIYSDPVGYDERTNGAAFLRMKP